MPVISTNTVSGGGYAVSASDPFVYVAANVVVAATNNFAFGIVSYVADTTLYVAGSVIGGGTGIGFFPTGDSPTSYTSILDDGFVSGRSRGIDFSGRLILSNAGTIESTLSQNFNDAAIVGNATSRLVLNNSGTIRTGGETAIAAGNEADRITNSGHIDGSVSLGGGVDRLNNTGTISGDVYLGTGDDTFNSARGTVTGTVSGGAGNDLYILGTEDINISESSNSGSDTVSTAFSFTLGNHFEVLRLRGGKDLVGRGNNLDNSLYGNDGSNSLYGNDGNDYLEGGFGDDKLYGGLGNDTIWAGDGTDLLEGAEGNDILSQSDYFSTSLNATLNGGAGDDIIYVYGGVFVANGSAGFDTLTIGSAFGAVTVDLAASTISGQGVVGSRISSIENLKASEGNDSVRGSGVANVLEGEGGHDTLLGFAGNDTLRGGQGADTLDGGDGNDIVSFIDVFTGITIDLSDGASGTAYGNVAVDDDVFVSIEGAEGTNYDDYIGGSNAANVLLGAGGTDEISGYNGNDTINGGDGNDFLSGGGGGDRFVFDDYGWYYGYYYGFGDDLINDFQNGVDKIDLTLDNRANSFADLIVTTVGNDTRITIVGDPADGGDSITLYNFSAALVDASDFLF